MKKIMAALICVCVLCNCIIAHAEGPDEISVMADALEATTGHSMSGWDASHYVYVYENDGIPYRAVIDFSEELCEQLEAIDFFDEERDNRIAEVIGPLPLALSEDLSQYYPSQDELNDWVGRSGLDLLNAGFEQSGYYCDEDITVFYMISGLFEYRIVFQERLEDGTDPEQALRRLTVQSMEINSVTNRATDWPLYYGEPADPGSLPEWVIPANTDLTDEVMTVFNQAADEFEDVSYEPIAFLGESDGVYCVLCRALASNPDAKPYYTLIYVSEDGVQNIWDIWMEMHAG